MRRVQTHKVHVAAIHHIERAGLEAQHVQHVHIVQLAVADVDEGRNGATQVQQRVQLDGRFGGVVAPLLKPSRAARAAARG